MIERRITLGTAEYVLSTPKLRHTVKILPALMRAGAAGLAGDVTTAMFDDMIAALAAGLADRYPDVTVDTLTDMPITMDQLTTAVQALAEVVELTAASAPGEAPEAPQNG